MQRILSSQLLLAILISFSSCTDFQEEEVPDRLIVDITEMAFPINGGSHSVTLSSGKKWDVASLPEWIRLQSINRSGRSPFEWTASFSATANEDYNREGTIYIRSGLENAEITITQEGKKGKYVAVESVSLSSTELTITEGDNVSLTPTITPSNASIKDVTWKSSTTDVATVSESGRVDAIAKGKAVITVTTVDGNKTATCALTVQAKTISVTGVSLDKTSLSLIEGDTYALTATITPSNATDKSVTWSSSNTSVATVSSSGVVTAKAAGSTTITVLTNNGAKKATCAVTVQAKTISVTGVSLDKTTLTLTEGDTQALNATITPSNATNKSVSWSSNNTAVATVSSSGVVTAKSAGSTTITVTTTDGGKKATCSVTVQAKTISVTGVSLSKNSLSMTEGETYTLTATITPSNATEKSVSWSSSNTSVATVSNAGLVTAKSAGSTTITATTTDGGKKATCSITVQAKTVSVTGVNLDKTSLTLTEGDSYALTATITPSNATDKSVTWSSNNTSIATVSSLGLVMAKAAGITTITVKTNDGGITATCQVTVMEPTKATSIALQGGDFMYAAKVGDEFSLSVDVKPEDANVDLEWSVSDESLAEIIGEGHSIILRAKDYGPSSLTVRDKVSNLSATEKMSARLTDFYWTENTGMTYNGCPLVEIEIGAEHQLQCHYTPEYATRVFRSDMRGFNYYEPYDYGNGQTSSEPSYPVTNPSLFSIDNNGIIKGIKEGLAKIHVYSPIIINNAQDLYVRIIKQRIPVEGVMLPKTIELSVGETQTLSATVTPSNATDKSVTWSSNNTSVATVSSSGLVTAKSAGAATITVTTNDGGKKATCSVTVSEPVVSVTGVSIGKTSLSIKVGDSQALVATITPSNATNKAITWSSSDDSVASVSSSGIVTGKKAGTANISVTTADGAFSVTCTVNVIEVPRAVDLGLSVKWASFNVGASKPEEFGYYYAWGETEPKDYFGADYKWWEYDGNNGYKYIKYCTNSDYGFNGFTDGKTILDSQDDVVCQIIGGKWRMPTKEELDELKNNCSWDFISLNGVDGFRATGPNGNSIFLPAGGFRSYGNREFAGVYGEFMSSSLCNSDSRNAYILSFITNISVIRVSVFDVPRFQGYSIRAVCE